MRLKVYGAFPVGVSSLRAAICVVLVLLFLYNPFFTIYSSTGRLTVRQPLSYRGTVASSELRRSLLRQVQPSVDAPQEQDSAFDILGGLLEGKHPHPGFAKDQLTTSSQDIFLEGLWFRPPPHYNRFSLG